MRILVVEDELKVANALREGLEIERYEVAVESTGEGGFFRMTTEFFDLMLLDVTLPGRDGLQILTSLRDRGVQTPVLVLTARDSIRDRVLGLNSGADDYIVKPFALAELIARIRALVRRGSMESMRFDAGDLAMDLLARKVTRGDQPVRLTVREFQLLEYCCGTRGRWCRAKHWPARSGRSQPGRPSCSTSSTCTSGASAGSSTSTGRPS